MYEDLTQSETKHTGILEINSSLSVSAPQILLFEGRKIDIHSTDIITTTNQQPKVYGNSYYGSDIRATWQSLITSSSLISDTNSG
ncbi:MAG: hypothetical protein U9Q15_02300 [Patescibacteria group bacterium]|nr:hypothetical protein [Patescibacteria group bacterium]